jgi:hypothetical protein
VGFTFGHPWHHPCYRPFPVYHYRPVPLFVETYPIYRPVTVVEPVPYVVQPAAPTPVLPPPRAVPAPTSSVTPAVAREERSPEVDRYLDHLRNPDEQVRADMVLQLGRMKVDRAVDPLAATLAGDVSPTVREAAARALGLIGSRRALPALTRAAQADSDRDVRNSARFAVEVIQSR